MSTEKRSPLYQFQRSEALIHGRKCEEKRTADDSLRTPDTRRQKRRQADRRDDQLDHPVEFSAAARRGRDQDRFDRARSRQTVEEIYALDAWRGPEGPRDGFLQTRRAQRWQVRQLRLHRGQQWMPDYQRRAGRRRM